MANRIDADLQRVAESGHRGEEFSLLDPLVEEGQDVEGPPSGVGDDRSQGGDVLQPAAPAECGHRNSACLRVQE